MPAEAEVLRLGAPLRSARALHAPEPYATRYAGRPYDGEVAWCDEQVGRLVSALREAGTLDDTLVIVTSDHGEALGEHGEDVHGYFVYESTLRVPLLLRGPGVTPEPASGPWPEQSISFRQFST